MMQLGTASLRLGDVAIGALAVVNAAGDIFDWRTGKIVAGARRPDGGGFADTVATLKRNLGAGKPHGRVDIDDPVLRSTTLVVVATNVDYSKSQLTKIAMMANAGGAWTIPEGRGRGPAPKWSPRWWRTRSGTSKANKCQKNDQPTPSRSTARRRSGRMP